MGDSQTMDRSREMKVTQIKAKVQSGEYQVDPVAVATAIVERLHEIARAQAERLTPSDPHSNHRTA